MLMTATLASTTTAEVATKSADTKTIAQVERMGVLGSRLLDLVNRQIEELRCQLGHQLGVEALEELYVTCPALLLQLPTERLQSVEFLQGRFLFSFPAPPPYFTSRCRRRR
ncbi:hypothetical protein TYRP_014913 [Tyrophagus putrescentiae]|nr:hypothetical protein TYRP_014913 [Tyrophagus putrescentiae]